MLILYEIRKNNSQQKKKLNRLHLIVKKNQLFD